MAMRLVVGLSLAISAVNSQQMYWNTIPTHGNEVLLVAGANLSTITTVKLCSSANCSRVISTLQADAWNESVKVIVPIPLIPPIFTVLCSNDSCMAPFSLNAPDIWWVYDGSQPTGSMGITGGLLRIYGRGIAWDAGLRCISSSQRQAASSTTLQLGTHTLVAINATCYEASFDLTGVAAGTYDQSILNTPWGSNTTSIVVAPVPSPSITLIDVDKDCGGDLVQAVAAASKAVGFVKLQLGPHEYALNQTLTLPNQTFVQGAGRDSSVIRVNFTLPPRTCGPVLPNTDFYFKPPYGHDLAYLKGVADIGTCCQHCLNDGSCNAYSLMKSEDECILKTCYNLSGCKGSPDTDRTSAFVDPATLPLQSDYVIVGHSQWGLADLTLLVENVAAKTPVVWGQPGGADVELRNINITMLQNNVSNAMQLESQRVHVHQSSLNQVGLCLWGPNGGVHDAGTDFAHSTTVKFANVNYGWFHDNDIAWNCSAFDLDVSRHFVFEDNTIHALQSGPLPHGNSISNYAWQQHPHSHHWVFAHNTQTRPPHNDPHNWAFHESVTTDGSGGWGAGVITNFNVSSRAITALGLSVSALSPIGARAIIVAGPGTGQSAIVVGVLDNHTVVVDMDLRLVTGQSVISVLAHCGHAMIVGNIWAWGMVVQWFGNIVNGVIADNRFEEMNVCSSGYGCKDGDGALESFGLCYGKQPQASFFNEFRGNIMLNSSGITLHDVSNDANCKATYSGPYLRWQIIRNNSLEGVALSSNDCAVINASNVDTTDVVVEGNVFVCPTGRSLPGGGVNVAGKHCLVRN